MGFEPVPLLIREVLPLLLLRSSGIRTCAYLSRRERYFHYYYVVVGFEPVPLSMREILPLLLRSSGNGSSRYLPSGMAGGCDITYLSEVHDYYHW